jgi:hypothetical protein
MVVERETPTWHKPQPAPADMGLQHVDSVARTAQGRLALEARGRL